MTYNGRIGRNVKNYPVQVGQISGVPADMPPAIFPDSREPVLTVHGSLSS